MIKRFCNICGNALPTDKYWNVQTYGSKEICYDCEHSIKNCINNRVIKNKSNKMTDYASTYTKAYDEGK